MSASPALNGTTLDLGRLATLLEIAGSSEHEGERSAAVRVADKMLRAAATTWQALLKPYRELETATQAAAALLAENDALRAALAQQEARGGAVTAWQDVNAAPAGNHRETARWVLDLHREGAVWLSGFELGFLDRCTTWTGRLTHRMQPVFNAIIERVIERTGLRPPP